MDRHVVIHSQRSDIASLIDDVRHRYAKTNMIILSNRDEVEPSWGATQWFYGSDVTTLCQRFRNYFHANPFQGQWIVVIDMEKTIPVSPAYNKLFRKKNITVVAVSDQPAVLNEHRFGTKLGLDDYVNVSSSSSSSSSSSWWWPW